MLLFLNTMNIYSILLALFGGLGLFIYGINLSSDELKKIAGFKLRKTIDKLTNNILFAILLGILITAVLQSSSATTVLLVSSINASIISFAKTIGVIIGANIGATLTVQIISFNLEQYAIPIIGFAIILSFFKTTKTSSKVILGFALLFLGLAIMKEAVSPINNIKYLQTYIYKFSKVSVLNFIILFILSTLFTLIIQASSATLGLLIAVASTGIINDFTITIPIILGSKTGTCITAFLASISSNRDGKRIAMTHLIFNLLAVFLTIIFMPYIVNIIKFISNDIARQIANTHTLISLFTAICISPFYKYLIIIVEKILPVKKDEESRLDIFNSKHLNNIELAISSIKKAITLMSEYTKQMIDISNHGISNHNYVCLYKLKDLEHKVNYYQYNIRYFLMEISKNELSGNEAIELNALREITDDFERIADHIENIIDNLPIFKTHKVHNKELLVINELYTHLDTNYSKMLSCFLNLNTDEALNLLKNKQFIKELFRQNIIKHNEMIKNGTIDAQVGMGIIDVLYNMKRISFHIRRILFNISKLNKKKC